MTEQAQSVCQNCSLTLTPSSTCQINLCVNKPGRRYRVRMRILPGMANAPYAPGRVAGAGASNKRLLSP